MLAIHTLHLSRGVLRVACATRAIVATFICLALTGLSPSVGEVERGEGKVVDFMSVCWQGE